jgi:hypothetical protein
MVLVPGARVNVAIHPRDSSAFMIVPPSAPAVLVVRLTPPSLG